MDGGGIWKETAVRRGINNSESLNDNNMLLKIPTGYHAIVISRWNDMKIAMFFKKHLTLLRTSNATEILQRTTTVIPFCKTT